MISDLLAWVFGLSLCLVAVNWCLKKRKKCKNATKSAERKANGNKAALDPKAQAAECERLRKLGTRGMFFDLLGQLNCNIRENEDPEDDRIVFDYQGQTFVAYVKDGCGVVNINYYGWESVKMDDIDELSRYRKAVNNVNITTQAKLFYTYDTEDTKEMNVHSEIMMVFVPELPDLRGWLGSVIDALFVARREFESELDKLRNGKQ